MSVHLLIELIVVLLIVVAFGIRTSWFQTFLAQQAASYLSSELQSEVAIDKVDIVFFDLVDLEGIYVEDVKKDTLLYAQTIRVNIADFSLRKSFLDIESVKLSNTQANLIKYKGDTTLNFQHIVDYFASEEVDTTTSKPFKVGVDKIELDNLGFRYHDQNARPQEVGMDYANIDLKHISGEFSDFVLNGDTIGATITDLKLKERSGLILTNLSTQALYSPTAIVLDDLKLGLNNSGLLASHLALKTPNGSADFSDFVNKVRFEGHIQNSLVSMTDIAYFVPSLHGMDTRVNLRNVEVSGPVYGMRLSNTDIRLMDDTRLKGNFQIPNLDDPETAFFDERIALFQTSVSDIEKLKLTPFLGGPDYLDLPESMDSDTLIRLTHGHFTGTLDNFVVDGYLTSGLGNVSTEYGLQFKKGTDGIYYFNGAGDQVKGRDIIVKNLNLGALSGNSLLGLTSGYVSINPGSRGLSMEELSLNFDGEFDNITLNDYDYQNIIIKKGLFEDNRFTGIIDVEDDNLALNYDGYVDLNNDMTFKFDVKIDSAKLAELNHTQGGIVDRLESKVKVEIQGTSLNEISGNVLVEDLNYQEGEIDFQLDRMDLSIVRNEVSDTILLKSELLDLELTGKFDLADMWPLVQHQLARVADHIVEDVDISESESRFFNLRVDLKNVNPLMQFTGHEIFVAEGSKLTSSYSLEDLKLNVEAKSDLVMYDGRAFEGIHLRNYFDSVRANVQYQIAGVRLSDSLKVKNAALFSYVKDNEFSTNVGWDGSGSIEPALFAFNTHLKENRDVLTEFRPSFFFLKDHKWNISPKSKLLWNTQLIELTDFDITNGDHLVSLKGKVSEDPEDWLYFQVRDFDLADLNGLLGGAVTIGGVLNIDGGVSDVYNNIKFMSLSDIKELVIDGELVGDLLVDNKWDRATNSVDILGNLKRDKKETFKFTGKYFTERKKDNLDLDLIFDKTDIGFLNAFSDPELYQNISGILDGKLKVTGELVDPVINGKLEVVKASVNVPMFNVDFAFAGDIRIGKDEILVDYMNVYDQEGNNAIAQMQIYHYDWADWNYDITLDMEGPFVSDRFLVMDTYYKDGDFYYGKAYISGDVNIFGYQDLTEITVHATTQKGTDIKLAMYGTGDLEESSFIIYDTIVPRVNLDELNDDGSKIESSGLVLDMNFEVTKETKATIVFDPIYEDQIVVDEGEGNIALKMDEFGEMDMYGKYTILAGNYFMRVKGLVKKDFEIRKGSNLAWTKSPYDALIDINADYKARGVSLNPILPPGIESTNEKTDVIASIQMGNTLMSPGISFGISAPNASEIGKTAIQSLHGDSDHLNKQFFSIVALNKFLDVYGSSGGAGSAAFDFAESQINDILNKFDQGISVELDANKTALDYQTQVNDRITIKTSFGVVSGNEDGSGSVAGSIVGDVTIEAKLNQDGSFTGIVFNESNQGSDAEKGPFTQGIGVTYQEQFDNTREFKLLQGFLNIFRKKENDVEYRSNRANGRKRRVPPENTEKKTP